MGYENRTVGHIPNIVHILLILYKNVKNVVLWQIILEWCL